MDEKKKDLIPVAAIALFLVIIIILCAVRLTSRRNKQEELMTQPVVTAEQTEETLTVEEEESETQTASADEVQGVKKESEQETTAAQSQSGAAKKTSETKEESSSESTEEAKLPEGWVAPEGSINSKDPFADAIGVDKTNEEMLSEMAGYWAEGRMDAVEDLAELAWFRKMSASIIDQNTFYYYGERNAAGQPEGTGIAVYADNEYYYGSWVNGKREGQGEWFKKYVYYDNDAVSDRAFQVHMYLGEWKNDLPNGMGQEHIDLDMKQAAVQGRYVQNVIGTFEDGLYNGEMYLTTLDSDSSQEEWNGIADGGIWSPYGAASSKKEVPVCQDVDDDDNYLWLAVRENQGRGIDELLD